MRTLAAVLIGVAVASAALAAEVAGVKLDDTILKVWLGDKPVDADLKRGLLGQT